MLNTCVISGRICFDIELNEVGGGQSVFKNILAVERNRKGQNGEKIVDYIPFTVWGKSAQYLYDYAKKGSMVAVSGSVRVDQYKASDGSDKKSFYVNANDVQIFGGYKDEKSEDLKPGKKTESPFNSPDEDLPF